MVTIVCVLVMAAGAIMIGGSQKFDWEGDSYWDSFWLEVGIFLTLIGAILSSLSLSHLVSVWKDLRRV